MPDYLDRNMYHMTHVRNLRNILHSGALLSQKELERRGLSPVSIANPEVQGLRDRIFVWDFAKKKYRPLHSYVPFYFTTDTPMLRYQRRQGILSDIIIFEVSRAYIGQEVLFTDGNASNQQLSKFYGEIVRIIPATASSGHCQREYKPRGPYGTNVNCSDFYADVMFLDRVRWDVIEGRCFIDDVEEYKRLKHAEVLAPDRFPLDEMLSICVSTHDMANIVRSIFAEMELSELDFDLPIVYKPRLFR